MKEFTTFEFECVHKSREWRWRVERDDVNESDNGESDEDNYSEENEGVESDDDEINVVDL